MSPHSSCSAHSASILAAMTNPISIICVCTIVLIMGAGNAWTQSSHLAEAQEADENVQGPCNRCCKGETIPLALEGCISCEL